MSSPDTTEKKKKKKVSDNKKGFWPMFWGSILLVASIICFDKFGAFHKIDWDSRAVVDSTVTKILDGRLLNANTTIVSQVKSDTSRGLVVVTREQKSIISEKVAFDSTYDLAANKKDTPQSIEAIRKAHEFRYYTILVNIRDSIKTSDDSESKVICDKLISVKKDDKCVNLLRKDSLWLPVEVTFRTNKIPGFVYHSTYNVPIKTELGIDKFVIEFPSFGMWVLLVILQIPAYCLLLYWLWTKLFEDYNNEFVRVIPNNRRYRPTKPTIYLHLICCLLACVAFAFALLYNSDDVMVKPQYFMFNLTYFLAVLNIGGYACAGFCLAGMLLTYISIRKVKKQQCVEDYSEFKNKYKVALEKKALSDEEKLKLDDKKNKEKEVLRLGKVTKYKDLSQRFNLYFTILGIILTLGVLCTSSLFAGLNSLPYIKAINKSQGFSQFPQDYVYLYGIIHSALLLIVYSLLKSQLNELKSKLAITDTDDKSNSAFSKKIIDVFTTGGPLLVPSLKAIFDYF